MGDETEEARIRLMEASVWITGALSGYCKNAKRNNPITTAETEEVTKLLKKIDAYWRTANYLSVGQFISTTILC